MASIKSGREGEAKERWIEEIEGVRSESVSSVDGFNWKGKENK